MKLQSLSSIKSIQYNEAEYRYNFTYRTLHEIESGDLVGKINPVDPDYFQLIDAKSNVVLTRRISDFACMKELVESVMPLLADNYTA